MANKTERPTSGELEHDEDRRAAMGTMVATAVGALAVMSSGIAGAEQRRTAAKRPDARTTDMIPREAHDKLSRRARSLTRRDLQLIAGGTFTAAERSRLRDVTFGDLKSVFDAVAASPGVSPATVIVPGDGSPVGEYPDNPCCCTCCE